MKSRTLCLILSAMIAVVANSTLADFVATGPIRGQVCKTYVVVDSCKMVAVDAVRGEDGRLYTLRTRYPQVSDHNTDSKGVERCWIVTKDRGMGVLPMLRNMFADLEFFTRAPTGGYNPVDVEYIVFPCRAEP